MTDQQHPITPPPELVQQWDREWREQQNAPVIGWSANLLAYITIRAAEWGADQELEACCEWIYNETSDDGFIAVLRAARRPNPLSLKEQALKVLSETELRHEWTTADEDIIRRALESIPDPS